MNIIAAIVTTPITTLRKAIKVSKYTGWSFIFSYGIKRLSGYACALYFDLVNKKYITTHSDIYFSLNDTSFRYFQHTYNFFHQSERKAELPIAQYYYNKYKNKKILELGNVLSHYWNVDHEIVDKYEYSPGVNNIDISEFHPKKSYDFIVSISTVEHVGKDDFPKDHRKALETIKKMKTWLSESGLLLITFGLGYNKQLDAQLFAGQLHMDVKFLKRVSSKNFWIEIPKSEALRIPYGFPYPCANAIAVCVYKKSSINNS